MWKAWRAPLCETAFPNFLFHYFTPWLSKIEALPACRFSLTHAFTHTHAHTHAELRVDCPVVLSFQNKSRRLSKPGVSNDCYLQSSMCCNQAEATPHSTSVTHWFIDWLIYWLINTLAEWSPRLEFGLLMISVFNLFGDWLIDLDLLVKRKCVKKIFLQEYWPLSYFSILHFVCRHIIWLIWSSREVGFKSREANANPFEHSSLVIASVWLLY